MKNIIKNNFTKLVLLLSTINGPVAPTSPAHRYGPLPTNEVPIEEHRPARGKGCAIGLYGITCGVVAFIVVGLVGAELFVAQVAPDCPLALSGFLAQMRSVGCKVNRRDEEDIEDQVRRLVLEQKQPEECKRSLNAAFEDMLDTPHPFCQQCTCLFKLKIVKTSEIQDTRSPLSRRLEDISTTDQEQGELQPDNPILIYNRSADGKLVEIKMPKIGANISFNTDGNATLSFNNGAPFQIPLFV